MAPAPVAVVLVTVGVLLFVGCGDEPTTAPSSSEPTASQSDDPTPTTPSSPGPTSGSQADDPVAVAVTDLASRLDIDPTGIEVVGQDEVTWRDASLGCPEPGMAYAQVLTDGSRILLEAGGRRYQYHAGGNRLPFLCDNPAR